MKRPRRRVTVEGLYYAHGLLCASYPITMLTFVLLVVVVISLPFFVTPTGDLNTPKPWRSPWLNYRVPVAGGGGGGALGEGMEWIVDNSTQFSGRVPSWFRGLPVALAQQIYVTVHVNCTNHSTFCQRSHFSSSKAVAGTLLDKLGDKTRSCYAVLHPAAISLTSELDPAHPPGVLSPLLDSVFTHWESDQQLLGFQTTKELLYGGFWQKEHSSTTPPSSSSSPSSPSSSSSPSKSHMFAITLLLDVSISRFSSLTHCIGAIKGVWPQEKTTPTTDSRAHFIKHFFYEPEWSLVEFLPLLSVYLIVFLYISFSVGKIDLVKSKVGLGFAAIVTLVCSLTMSLGICTFFGLSISLTSSEVYPFFVIVLGLENILIIVKAVMSTPEEFEVKERIAAGLSKEGWAISCNLSTLLLMLCMGIVFFNYTMKEFCIVGLVALLCDAFLQLFFFPTVLSIDLRRLELSDLGPDPVSVAMQQASEGSPATVNTQGPCPTSLHITPPLRWRSKRVKFAYFLASARLVSRAIMVAMVVSMMVVWAAQTDKLQKLLGFDFVLPIDSPSSLPAPPTSNNEAVPAPPGNHHKFPYQQQGKPQDDDPTTKAFSNWEKTASEDLAHLMKEGILVRMGESDGWSVRCDGGDKCWRNMVTTHWPKLLQHYGFSTENRFLSVLPPIMLTFNLGISSTNSTRDSTHIANHTHQTFLYVLSHPYFIRGGVAACLVGVVLVYTVWLIRSTLRRMEGGGGGGGDEGGEEKWQMKNSSLFTGHTQDIESLCVKEEFLVSASLDGDIRVWNTDTMTRGCVLTISRGELCGDLSAYADRWRPDAEGCEAAGDNKSVRSLQMGPSGGPTPVNFNIGGSTTVTGGLKTSQGTKQISKRVVYPMMSPATNQISAQSGSPHGTLGRSMSAQNMRDVQTFRSPPPPPLAKPRLQQPHPLLGQHSAALPPPPPPPSSPPPSPHPPSPNTPLHINRRHSTHSLQENLYFQQFYTPSSTAPPLSPPASAPPTNNPNFYQTTPTSSARPIHQQATPTSSSSAHHTTPQAAFVPLCGLPTAPPTTTLPSPPPPPPQSRPHSAVTSRAMNTPSTSLQSPSSGVSTTSRSADANKMSLQSNASSTQPSTKPISRLDGGQGLPPSSASVSHKGPPRTRHTRSKSSGPIPPHPLPPPPHSPSLSPSTTSSSVNRRTHSRNLSASHVTSHVTTRTGRTGAPGTTPELLRPSIPLSPKFPPPAPPPPSSSRPPPDPTRGYDFAKHFHLFSPFTSNFALEYRSREEEDEEEGSKFTSETPPPAVWCMDVWNDSIAVGCGNGQIEVWNMRSGSLDFAVSTNLPGATVISISSLGIVTGHMNGSLHIVGLDSQQRHTLPAHTRPVSALRCGGGRVVSGGYDGAVVVHWVGDLVDRERTITVHSGNQVTSLVLDQTATLCVSGCGGGVVCAWDLATGNCHHMLQESGGDQEGVAVIKLEVLVGVVGVGGAILGLMSDETVLVWDKSSGENLYTITLEGVCSDFALLGGRYMAACNESQVMIYDLESGQKRFEMPVEGGERGVVLIRHLLPLKGGTHVVCSNGPDLHLLHCGLKQKVE